MKITSFSGSERDNYWNTFTSVDSFCPTEARVFFNTQLVRVAFNNNNFSCVGRALGGICVTISYFPTINCKTIFYLFKFSFPTRAEVSPEMAMKWGSTHSRKKRGVREIKCGDSHLFHFLSLSWISIACDLVHLTLTSGGYYRLNRSYLPCYIFIHVVCKRIMDMLLSNKN